MWFPIYGIFIIIAVKSPKRTQVIPNTVPTPVSKLFLWGHEEDNWGKFVVVSSEKNSQDHFHCASAECQTISDM